SSRTSRANAPKPTLFPYTTLFRSKPSEFEHNIRWMVKTYEEQALGFSMPSTAQTDGYIEEQRKGNIKSILPNESVEFSVETGILRPVDSEEMKEKIQNDKRI